MSKYDGIESSMRSQGYVLAPRGWVKKEHRAMVESLIIRKQDEKQPRVRGERS